MSDKDEEYEAWLDHQQMYDVPTNQIRRLDTVSDIDYYEPHLPDPLHDLVGKTFRLKAITAEGYVLELVKDADHDPAQ